MKSISQEVHELNQRLIELDEKGDMKLTWEAWQVLNDLLSKLKDLCDKEKPDYKLLHVPFEASFPQQVRQGYVAVYPNDTVCINTDFFRKTFDSTLFEHEMEGEE